MVVRRAMKFSAIVAGGGAIEMELSRFLIKNNNNLKIFKTPCKINCWKNLIDH